MPRCKLHQTPCPRDHTRTNAPTEAARMCMAYGLKHARQGIPRKHCCALLSTFKRPNPPTLPRSRSVLPRIAHEFHRATCQARGQYRRLIMTGPTDDTGNIKLLNVRCAAAAAATQCSSTKA
eukprot:4790314-Alexandrium_andersonii.AAC.1